MSEDLLRRLQEQKPPGFQPTPEIAPPPLAQDTWIPLAQLVAGATQEELALIAAGKVLPPQTGELADEKKWERALDNMVQYASSLRETRNAASSPAPKASTELSSHVTLEGSWTNPAAPALPPANTPASPIAPATGGELRIWGLPGENTAQEDRRASSHGRHTANELGGEVLSLMMDLEHGTFEPDLSTGRHAADARPTPVTSPLSAPSHPGLQTVHDTPRPSSN